VTLHVYMKFLMFGRARQSSESCISPYPVRYYFDLVITQLNRERRAVLLFCTIVID